MRPIFGRGLLAIQAACKNFSGPLWDNVPRLMHAVRRAYPQIMGIPDYEHYVAHMALNHPDDPVLSRREFYVQSINRKYSRSGPRCC